MEEDVSCTARESGYSVPACGDAVPHSEGIRPSSSLSFFKTPPAASLKKRGAWGPASPPWTAPGGSRDRGILSAPETHRQAAGTAGKGKCHIRPPKAKGKGDAEKVMTVPVKRGVESLVRNRQETAALPRQFKPVPTVAFRVAPSVLRPCRPVISFRRFFARKKSAWVFRRGFLPGRHHPVPCCRGRHRNPVSRAFFPPAASAKDHPEPVPGMALPRRPDCLST